MRIRLSWRMAGVMVFTATALIAQTKPQVSDTRPFIGTWTALYAGTPIIDLHLHSEKGELAGEVQACSYSVNTETTGTVDVVTDPTLSKSVPLKNIKVSGKSISVDWKDPDGDNDHWRLELTGKNADKSSGSICRATLKSNRFQ